MKNKFIRIHQLMNYWIYSLAQIQKLAIEIKFN